MRGARWRASADTDTRGASGAVVVDAANSACADAEVPLECVSVSAAAAAAEAPTAGRADCRVLLGAFSGDSGGTGKYGTRRRRRVPEDDTCADIQLDSLRSDAPCTLRVTCLL